MDHVFKPPASRHEGAKQVLFAPIRIFSTLVRISHIFY